jgi:hypothetical protein
MTSRRPESTGSTIPFVLIPQHIHAHHPLSRDTLLAATGVCPHTYYFPCDSGRLRAASSKRSTPPQRSGTAVSDAWRAGRQLELTSLSPTNSSSRGLSLLRQSYYDLHWVRVTRGTRLLGTFQPPSRDNYDIFKPIKGPPTAGAPTACCAPAATPACDGQNAGIFTRNLHIAIFAHRCRWRVLFLNVASLRFGISTGPRSHLPPVRYAPPTHLLHSNATEPYILSASPCSCRLPPLLPPRGGGAWVVTSTVPQSPLRRLPLWS